MLTVIISRKSSQGFIDRYRTLFEPHLEAGRIAFCFWDEHGTDVASALPELAGIVRGVRRWRAIVALPLEQEEAAAEAAAPENPFDFLCNRAAEPVVHESHIPLIRLAQMLGGVPLVNQHYESVLEPVRLERRDDEAEDEYRLRRKHTAEHRLAIRRKEQHAALEAQQAVWDDLNDKYSFNCDRPSMLYLFAARKPQEIQIPKVTDREAMRRRESDSSMFWYRNRYPAKARFLIQDCSRAGNAHFREDLFRFWMTVLTLSLNDVPTGTFEAYKVYQVRADVEQEQVHQVFSDYYNRLSSVQYAANRQIIQMQKDMQLTREQDELPLYEHEVPVVFTELKDEDLFVEDDEIGLAGDCPSREEPWWHEMVRRSRRAVRRLLNSQRMVLDRASTMCRYAAKVNEEEIHELDEYQFEEMNEQLSELEKEILTFSTSSVLPRKKYQRDMERAEKSAATSMRKRMSRKTTVTAGVVSVLIFLLGFLPDFISQVRYGTRVESVFLLAGWGCVLLCMTAMGCLFHFRKVIVTKIRDYNGIVGSIVADMIRAQGAFTRYLSKCCSYMRGRSMLQALQRRTMISTEGIVMLNRHTEQLAVQMDVIDGWLADFDRKPLPDGGIGDQTDFDFQIPPEKNREYLLLVNPDELEIPSVGGSVCKAPYPFVTQLNVLRERLYEKRAESEEEEV